MQGLGVEAARQLAAATTQLRQLERDVTDAASTVADLEQRVATKKGEVSQLRKQREQHQKHHDELLFALTNINERNQKLLRDIKTKQEVRTNLRTHLGELGALHRDLAVDMDRSAMNIQVLSAKLEASGIEGLHEEGALRELRRQKLEAERDAHQRTSELSRLRVHNDKVLRESLYVERTLEHCSASEA